MLAKICECIYTSSHDQHCVNITRNISLEYKTKLYQECKNILKMIEFHESELEVIEFDDKILLNYTKGDKGTLNLT